jgi:hypothetical protein
VAASSARGRGWGGELGRVGRTGPRGGRARVRAASAGARYWAATVSWAEQGRREGKEPEWLVLFFFFKKM